MSITTNEFGQQNMFAKEPTMYIDSEVQEQMDNGVYETHNEKAERLNGRLAMLGFVAAIGAYALTGQIIPGVW
jgi:cell division protein FtsN